MIKMEDMYPLILEAFSKGETFSFPIHGTSMQPLLHTNDLVTISAIKTMVKGDIILFRRNNGQFVLHRIYTIKGNRIEFVGDHQAEVEKGINSTQCIGKVIQYKKQGKDKIYSLKGIRYNIYKRLVRIKFFRRICSKVL